MAIGSGGPNDFAEKSGLKSVPIKKILLPVDFPATSVSVFQQAVTLAERFQAELVMLHVATVKSHEAGVPVDDRGLAKWNLLDEILQTDNKFDDSLRTKLKARVVRALVVRDDTAHAIVRTAESENVDLIMLPSRGETFDQFLFGSATMTVPRWKECPVWTGAFMEEPSPNEFSIRSILCAVGLGPRNQEAASWAAQLAAAFGAHLTLCNVTASMAIVAPGGTWANPRWQQALVDGATKRLTELRKSLGIKADLLVGVGEAPKALSQLASQSKSDLLVLDCYPYSGNLRLHGYAVICAVSIPVLSV
jgi:nucleotide-binding universal stress UspA family protein